MGFSERAPDYRRRVEKALDALIPARSGEPGALGQAMRHAVFNGGKRMRPLLSYAAAEALAIDPAEADACACAVELVHCYSLVHDDLPAMDDDDLRRGQPTVHRAFDEATAILAGDALLTLAFECLARAAADPAVVLELARAAGADGMVGGQAMDLAFESTRPSRESLETMFRRKTGALIRAAVVMPAAALRGSDHPFYTALSNYAESVGLAFQIVDDLLDIEGTTEEIGKPAGSDEAQHKATWPALFGIEASRDHARELLARAGEALEALPGDTDGLRWLGQRVVDRRN